MSEVTELIGVVPAPDWGAWEPLALSMLTAGAAALILACLTLLRGKGERAARPFSLAALIAGLTGQSALFVSLEQPLRAYEFFLHPSSTSWTAAGAYIVPVFLLAALGLVVRTRAPHPGGRLFAALALVPGIAVFVYATNEIMACVGRALWTSPYVPPLFLLAGVAGGLGLAACLADGRSAGPLVRTLGGYSALAAGGCAAMALLLPAPAGFAAEVTVWWHAPGLLCLLAVIAAVIAWRRGRLGAFVAGLCSLSASFLLFWKLIQMGQAFPRDAATVMDKAVFLDLLSGPSLLALAGTVGLLVALGALVPMLLPEKPLAASHGAR